MNGMADGLMEWMNRMDRGMYSYVVEMTRWMEVQRDVTLGMDGMMY